jgi:hypothetical protein
MSDKGKFDSRKPEPVNSQHAVCGQPDPNFKPDPNAKMVWDSEKGVYRKTRIN